MVVQPAPKLLGRRKAKVVIRWKHGPEWNVTEDQRRGKIEPWSREVMEALLEEVGLILRAFVRKEKHTLEAERIAVSNFKGVVGYEGIVTL